MKNKLKDKYVSLSYYDRLLDNWQWFPKALIPPRTMFAQFDEFLIRCNVVSTESNAQVLPDLELDLKKTCHAPQS